MRTIVVGVDGSSGSLAALRFAVEEARLRGSKVRAVSAWLLPPAAYKAGLAKGAIDQSGYEELARSSLMRALEALDAHHGVTVEPFVAEGQAAGVLCACAEGAELLVLGSRGLGGFRGLLLGSVSQQCARHAPCPVVIVPREASLFPSGSPT